MSRKFKTGKNNRFQYIYYTAEGENIKLTPGEDGMTEEFIKLLHSMDDFELDEHRRYEHRVTGPLDAYEEFDIELANNQIMFLADESTNPEKICIRNQEEQEYQNILDILTEAMQTIPPQQKALFKKAYIDKRTNTEIAIEEGVTEAAIRNRLKKMHSRIKNIFNKKGGSNGSFFSLINRGINI